ncbi:MAG: Ig-like domain-containing protein, partial [Gemmatimonadetes bacterium]|nr:Ig-like domain-containing protein [Gemmatimonadota bacterium]
TYEFGADADSLALRLNVRLGPSAAAFGEELQLVLAYINAEGDTVFKGGPAMVVARRLSADGGPPPPPVIVPVHYEGPGAHATTVTLTPQRLEVTTGEVFAFSAHALDARGAEVAGAPIIYQSLDPGRAELTRFTAGVGLATGSRGSVNIVASLLNGAADTAQLIILPRAHRLLVVSGGGQSGEPGAVLGQPVVARVVDAANDGVQGVDVHFAAGTGGEVSADKVATDSDGYARTTWRLGHKPGTQMLAVSSDDLLGSPFSVAATAVEARPPNDTSGHGGSGGGPSDLSKAVMTIVSGDRQAARIGTLLESPLVVKVTDESGKPLADVAMNWKPVGQGGTASADSTTTDANGLSSNKWTLGTRDGAQSLKVSLDHAGGVAVTFTATALTDAGSPMRKLGFVTGPTPVAVGVEMRPAVVVGAFDAQGKHDSTFVGRVSLELGGAGSATARLAGTSTVTAVGGLAVFDRLHIDDVGESLVLVATAAGVESATSAPFAVTNPPTEISMRSGDGQHAKPNETLKQDLVVVIEDARHRGLAGVTVTWRVVSGGGSVTASSVSDAHGRATASWTLGPTPGAQTVTASVNGLLGSPVTFTATAKR